MTTQATERWTYSPDEVAALTGMPPQTVRAYCRDGRIASIPCGKHRLIPRAEVARLTGADPVQHEQPSGIDHRAERENERLRLELRRLRDEIDRLLA